MYDESTSHIMALANHLMNVKDSRWLQLEVCREFQRGQCSRTDTECKFAHPPPHVEIQNGRVTACYDSIKGRCTRENPKCKYLHPPQHLKDQLLINGRNNLALKNLFMNQLTTPQAAVAAPMGVNHLAMPGAGALVPGAYGPYAYALNTAAVYPGLVTSPEALGAVGGMLPAGTAASPAANMAAAMAAQAQAQKVATSRADRVEVCREFVRGTCQRSESECKFAHPPANVDRASDGTVTVCMDFVHHGGACARNPCRFFHPPAHLALSTTTNGAKAAPLQRNANNGVVCLNANGDAACHSPRNLINAMPTTSMPLAASAVSMAAAHAAAAVNASQFAAAAAQAAGATIGSKKRPLEQEPCPSPSTADSYFLAAAALNTPVNKRAAYEKGGVPVFQPVTHMATMGGAYHYPQFSAIPGLQTSYMPAMAFTASALSPNSVRSVQQSIAPSTNAQLASLISNGCFAPTNAASVAYFDESGQLLDTLPVCRDFKQGRCDRPNCRYVHLIEDYVEVNDGKITVCRDFAKGKCTRVMCKYYHVPMLTNSLLLNRLMSPTSMHSANSLSPATVSQQYSTAAARLSNVADLSSSTSSSAFGAIPFSALGFPQVAGNAAMVDHTAFILAQQQQQQQAAAAMYLASLQQ